MHLQAEFEALPSPAQPTRTGHEIFSVLALPSSSSYLLGKDAQGRPALLIRSTHVIQPSASPVRLQHLAVDQGLHCLVSLKDGPAVEGTFTVIRCLSQDPGIRNFFLEVMEELVALLGPDPVESQVATRIAQLSALFAAFELPATKTVRGLWAELYLLATASDPVRLISAWHGDPRDLVDFGADQQYIEVKGSANEVRHHRFRLEQLELPATSEGLVASMFVISVGEGSSVLDLLDLIRQKVAASAESRWRLDSVAAATLGSGLGNASEARFDMARAESSLNFYFMREVPRPDRAHIPAEVSEVRFVVDVSNCHGLRRREVRHLGGLFSSL